METKVCKCCGRELSIDKFRETRLGRRNTCDECVSMKINEARKRKKETQQALEYAKDARLLRIQDFTPRELMKELNRRGYVGKLEFTVTHEIDITQLDD